MTDPKTQTLDLPGATLTYDVREAASESTEPVLLMIGSPMDAGGFTTLAGHFPGTGVKRWAIVGAAREGSRSLSLSTKRFADPQPGAERERLLAQ